MCSILAERLIKKISKKWRKTMKRGDIYYADLNPVLGCEQGGLRPVLVIQNNIGNRCSPTIIVAAISNKNRNDKLPTHVCINVNKLRSSSIAMLEQIRTIDRIRLKSYIGSVNHEVLKNVDMALTISVGLEQK